MTPRVIIVLATLAFTGSSSDDTPLWWCWWCPTAVLRKSGEDFWSDRQSRQADVNIGSRNALGLVLQSSKCGQTPYHPLNNVRADMFGQRWTPHTWFNRWLTGRPYAESSERFRLERGSLLFLATSALNGPLTRGLHSKHSMLWLQHSRILERFSFLFFGEGQGGAMCIIIYLRSNRLF